MTIEKIKTNIMNSIGKDVRVVYNGSRNRVETYNGIIAEVYNFVFIVKLDSLEKMSFTYSDVLTNSVELYF